MKTFLEQCQSQEKTATAGADLVPSTLKSEKSADYLKVGPGESKPPTGNFHAIVQKIIAFFKKQDVGDLAKQAQKIQSGDVKLADLKGMVNSAMDTDPEEKSSNKTVTGEDASKQV